MRHILSRISLTGMLICFLSLTRAQELFVYTEPASNMPAKSVGLRASNWLMPDNQTHTINYQFIPEVMVGAGRKLMIHADGFFSNQNGHFHAVGGGTYLKYRFYSSDQVNRHFRLAAFGRLSLNNSAITQEEIDLSRFNTGWALGIVGTQLLHKQAISASVSYNRDYNNGAENKIPPGQADQAVNYTLSTGRLIFPRNYENYRQTNLNLMVELLGQDLVHSGGSYLDLASAVQFIFNSQTRVDIGYKFQLYSAMQRTTPNGFMIRFEHLLFNVL